MKFNITKNWIMKNAHKEAGQSIEAGRPTEPKQETETLGTALPKEIERVQGLIEIYKTISPTTGNFAIALMRNDIRMAQHAMIKGDLISMIRIYKSLKEYKE
jgi:hypothetical protein